MKEEKKTVIMGEQDDLFKLIRDKELGEYVESGYEYKGSYHMVLDGEKHVEDILGNKEDLKERKIVNL